MYSKTEWMDKWIKKEYSFHGIQEDDMNSRREREREKKAWHKIRGEKGGGYSIKGWEFQAKTKMDYDVGAVVVAIAVPEEAWGECRNWFKASNASSSSCVKRPKSCPLFCRLCFRFCCSSAVPENDTGETNPFWLWLFVVVLSSASSVVAMLVLVFNFWWVWACCRILSNRLNCLWQPGYSQLNGFYDNKG